MDNGVLDLSGPGFLLAYPAALAVGLALLGVCWLELHRWCRRPPRRPVDLDELAYLAGDRERVVQTSVARLVESGSLRPSRSHHVAAVSGATAEPALDRAVLESATQRSPKTVAELTSRLVGHPVLDEIAARVGGIVPADRHRALRYATLAAAPAALVVLIGVLRLVSGIGLGNPVGLLVLELVISIVLLVWAVGRVRRSVEDWWWGSKHPLVLEGNYTVRDADTVSPTALRVVLNGLRGYPDPVVRDALVPPPPKRVEPAAVDGASAASAGYAGAANCGGGGCGGGCGCGG